MTLRIVTANVDFALPGDKVKLDLERILKHADIITFQEAKSVNINALIKDPKWKVLQNMSSSAKKGSGIAYNSEVVKVKRHGMKVGTTARGRAIQTRFIMWAVFTYHDSTNEPHDLLVISMHLPPKRYWAVLYNVMLASLMVLLRSKSSRAIVVGADWNRHVRSDNVLTTYARKAGGRFYGVGIDGFLFIPKGLWKYKKVDSLFDTHSDHDPVQLTIEAR